MNHSFSVEVAIRYGVPCALVLGHIDFLIAKAKKDGANKHNGKYWANKSVKKIAEMYPYYTEKQIRRAIDKLRSEGLVITNHFPTSGCPSTLWYTLSRKGKTMIAMGVSDLPPGANQFDPQGETFTPPGQNEQPPGANQFDPQGVSSTKVLDTVLDSVVDSCNKELEEDARARGSDTDWTAFVREYQSNIGLLPTSTVEREDMTMFFEEFGLDALREFIHYTARKHPDNPHVYFSNLCRRYLGKGITTAEQARASFLDHDRAKKGGRNGGENRGRASEPPRRLGRETIV